MDSIVARCTTSTDSDDYNILPVWFHTRYLDKLNILYDRICALLLHETTTIHVTVFSHSVPFLDVLYSKIRERMSCSADNGYTRITWNTNTFTIKLYPETIPNPAVSCKQLYIYDIKLCTSADNWCQIFHSLADVDTTCIFVGTSNTLTPSFVEYIHLYNMPIYYI